MAISPIGNVTYINQNSQANATQQANATSRNDAINLLNKEFEDKIKDIQEVRPTEDTKSINPDAKGGGGGAFKGEANESESKNLNTKDSPKDKTSIKSSHILDIKV